MESSKVNKFRGCILGGAIGDAWGSSFENIAGVNNPTVFHLGNIPEVHPNWQFTDDTMLNLATCEVLKTGKCTPELLGNKFVEYYIRNEIVGIGASTLKSIKDLKAGYHWTEAGRKGEFGAGNGSAMRIAPFAFYDTYTRDDIRDFSKLTHNNDEAYVGALAVYFVIRELISSDTTDFKSILHKIISELPDTNVKDRIIELNTMYDTKSINEISQLGNSGYVVHSVPFSIYSAFKIDTLGFEGVINEIIESGGDTDTNASIAGQIMGAHLGYSNLSNSLLSKLKSTRHYSKIETIIFT
jgi:ADP-ribosyl-[dinitrogen reductase] hydrolase